MELEQKIKEILERGFIGAQVEAERDIDSEKIGGRIVWKGFTGNNSLRRQNRIHTLLRKDLSRAEMNEISILFTYTPEELEQVNAA